MTQALPLRRAKAAAWRMELSKVGIGASQRERITPNPLLTNGIKQLAFVKLGTRIIKGSWIAHVAFAGRHCYV